MQEVRACECCVQLLDAVSVGFLYIDLKNVGDFVDYVDDENGNGKAQGDELNQPEAEQGDGGEDVVAHVSAARLDSVADEAVLLVLVQRVASEEEEDDAEEEHHD